MINKEQLIQDINNRFGDFVSGLEEPFGLLTLTVRREKLLDLVAFLKDSDVYRFRFLTDICGIHYPDMEGGMLCSVAHLHSLEHNFRLRLKVFVSVADPVVPSLVPHFLSANWMERETYDFFGIIYSGHPDLRRILNMDEMDYFPMRKEYPLEDQGRGDKIDSKFGR